MGRLNTGDILLSQIFYEQHYTYCKHVAIRPWRADMIELGKILRSYRKLITECSVSGPWSWEPRNHFSHHLTKIRVPFLIGNTFFPSSGPQPT